MPESGPDPALSHLLCAAVRGEPGVWRDLRDSAAQSRFLAAASLHRIRPLLAWRLDQAGELPLWPEPVRRSLVNAARAEATLEVLRRVELNRVLQAFEVVRLPVVLLKGAALAYSVYPEPWLRPRHDTDLLIRPADSDEAGRVLARAGYRPADQVSGELVISQRTYARCDARGLRHDYDLHWKAINPLPFADLVSPDELLHEAEPISLGDGWTARAPRRVHALLLACVHRVLHHYDSGDLLWLYDIHLLADPLDGPDAADLLAVARRTGVGALCARGMRLAGERFGTRVNPSLLTTLEAPSGVGPSVATVYLRPEVRRIDLVLADLQALDWRRRWRLIREHLFPPADYLLARYGWSSRLLLPVLYLWRIATGAPRWLRRL